MENISNLNNLVNNDYIYDSNNSIGMISYVKPIYSPVNSGLTAVGGKNFFRYLKRFNLTKEPDLLILSPNSHFYYDANDLKNIRTLINLKKLNWIKDLDAFLQTLVGII